MKTAKIKRQTSAQKHSKKRDKVKKSRTAVNFEPKIRTVPLKVGQLESMLSFASTIFT